MRTTSIQVVVYFRNGRVEMSRQRSRERVTRNVEPVIIAADAGIGSWIFLENS
jgi:hypothetical protein